MSELVRVEPLEGLDYESEPDTLCPVCGEDTDDGEVCEWCRREAARDEMADIDYRDSIGD